MYQFLPDSFYTRSSKHTTIPRKFVLNYLHTFHAPTDTLNRSTLSAFLRLFVHVLYNFCSYNLNALRRSVLFDVSLWVIFLPFLSTATFFHPLNLEEGITCTLFLYILICKHFKIIINFVNFNQNPFSYLNPCSCLH